jgi:8-hydroxy-5-deazaflavin:NADPH oxidoreductase
MALIKIVIGATSNSIPDPARIARSVDQIMVNLDAMSQRPVDVSCHSPPDQNDLPGQTSVFAQPRSAIAVMSVQEGPVGGRHAVTTSEAGAPQEAAMRRPGSLDCSRRALLAACGTLALGAALQARPGFAQTANDTKQRIGVIGSGKIGGTIGGLWVKNAHPVLFSSRHPDELKDLVTGLGPLAQAGSVAQAISFGDVLFVAVPYGALPQVGRDYAEAMKGKIVLDACNAVAGRDGQIAEEVERDGIGITSEKYLPGTLLVRAFNTLNYSIFAREANRPDPKLAIPIAGDDPDALQIASGLVRDAGFDPVVVGKLADARIFQRGGPGYGQAVSAAELKQKLAL